MWKLLSQRSRLVQFLVIFGTVFKGGVFFEKKLGIAITSIIVILGAFYLFKSESSVTLNEVFDTSEITSIEIIRSSDNKEVVIENSSDVKELLKRFSRAELNEDNMGTFDFNESYWITLRTNGTRKIGMTFYDEKFLSIYNYNGHKQYSYQIINGFNSSSIEKHFN